MKEKFDRCFVCDRCIRPRQDVLQCDGCNRFQHRTCGTTISRQVYRQMVRGDIEEEILDWRCRDCSLPNFSSASVSIPEPVAESTRASFQQPPPSENANNSSFQLENNLRFENEEDLVEASVVDPLPTDANIELGLPLVFSVVDDASQRGKRKLFDSMHYSYTVKSHRGMTTYWTCSIRSSTNRCPATVIEKNQCFTPGSHLHNHPPVPGQLTAATVVKQAKKGAIEHVFQSAAVIVEDVILEEVNTEEPCPALPCPVNIARAANRARQRIRPAEPSDLQFELAEDFIQADFFRRDVKVGLFRHLLFATDRQLHLLGSAKTWYMDATFNVVKQPFVQLFSIHAFVKSDVEMKQIPMAFCLMSRRRRKDYKKVFQAVRDFQPNRKLKKVVADFEAGMWQGCREVFPEVRIKGCCFHWSQAVIRKVKSLGLEPAYLKQTATYRLIKKLMALPYLPAEHIPEAFEVLSTQATTPQLEELTAYIRSTWLESSIWEVRNWSVFGQSIRTNNHVEGWHRRLNHRAMRGNLQFYLLLDVLYKEAHLVNIHLTLVSEGKLRRSQRSKTKSRHAKIAQLWDEYRDGQKTASQLLRLISIEL